MNKTQQLANLRTAEFLILSLPLSARNHLVRALNYWYKEAKDTTPITSLQCALSQTAREITKS